MMSTQGVSRRGVLAGVAALAGCAAQTTASVDTTPRLGPDRTGYILLQAPIVDKVRDLFIANVNQLLTQDAREIYVLMASLGGVLTTMQDIIAFMDRTRAERGVMFTTHNVGFVASAACYVFLAGQRRLSIARGTFLFHEASLVANGPITMHELQDESSKSQALERSLLQILTRRTHLSEAEASSFIHRTVILNADEAQRDGVIDAISGFALPKGANMFQIRAVQNKALTPGEPHG
jgi:ATP-dependent protease ClpP protease subunit